MALERTRRPLAFARAARFARLAAERPTVMQAT